MSLAMVLLHLDSSDFNFTGTIYLIITASAGSLVLYIVGLREYGAISQNCIRYNVKSPAVLISHSANKAPTAWAHGQIHTCKGNFTKSTIVLFFAAQTKD
jgi:hypothetical protein